MSQSGSLLTGGGPGSGIQTISGDVGSISGTNVTIYTANPSGAGGSILFNNSETTSVLQVTDAQGNTVIGANAGTTNLAGSNGNTSLGQYTLRAANGAQTCTAIGYASLISTPASTNCTTLGAYSMETTVSGDGNTAIGSFSMEFLQTGSNNLAIGYTSGLSYGGSESNNVLLANTGVIGESNVMRLGTTGPGTLQVDQTFIAGVIDTLTPANDNHVMVINNVTEQVTVVSGGTSGQVLTTDGSGNLSWQTVTENVQVFTTSGTYTPSPGLQFAIVRLTGGGGGGGGSPDLSAAINQVGPAAGGGSAGYVEGIFDAATIGVSQTVTIGNEGDGGDATGSNGTDGGNTLFGALLEANGGGGGIGSGIISSNSVVNIPEGGAGGSATGGYLQIPGQAGSGAFGFTFTTLSIAEPTALYAEGGIGGSNPLGMGGAKINASSPGENGVSGLNGNGYGSGGGGAASVQGSSTGEPGGNGAPGIVIITEYIIP